MCDAVLQSLQYTLDLWQQMKMSDPEDAAEDADRFQQAFYDFTDHVRNWVDHLQNRPADVEEARLVPEFAELFARLPEPLQIPFESELDSILSDIERNVDSTEQS